MDNLYLDGYAALLEMCGGKTSQEIAHHLISVDGIWGDKSLDTGSARIRACLNKDKPEFFKAAELIAIQRFTKRYDAVFFMCDELGLSRPQPVSTEEQLSKVSNSINSLANNLARVVEQFSRIESQATSYEEDNVVRAINFSKDIQKETKSW